MDVREPGWWIDTLWQVILGVCGSSTFVIANSNVIVVSGAVCRCLLRRRCGWVEMAVEMIRLLQTSQSTPSPPTPVARLGAGESSEEEELFLIDTIPKTVPPRTQPQEDDATLDPSETSPAVMTPSSSITVSPGHGKSPQKEAFIPLDAKRFLRPRPSETSVDMGELAKESEDGERGLAMTRPRRDIVKPKRYK